MTCKQKPQTPLRFLKSRKEESQQIDAQALEWGFWIKFPETLYFSNRPWGGVGGGDWSAELLVSIKKYFGECSLVWVHGTLLIGSISWEILFVAVFYFIMLC